jgi:uncharacterized membrane protein YcaP (DUF421 family)
LELFLKNIINLLKNTNVIVATGVINLSDIVEVIIRTLGAFILFMIMARILGKQTISQMTLHDFIAAICLGAIVGNLSFNVKLDYKLCILAFLIFGGTAYLASIISKKSRKARKWLSGQPTILIQEGKILEENIGKINYTLDYLNQTLRERDIFNIEEVEYAILEIDGHLSVLKKPEYQTVTKRDLGIMTPSQNVFPIELIMDGKIVQKNLVENQLSEDWLRKEITKNNFKFSDINYAVKGTNNQIYFDLYKDRITNPMDKE